MLRTPTITRPKSVEDLISADLIARLDPLDLTSRKVFFGKLKGERRSKKRGESVEFADHRPYVVGDDTRHIDWNIFARLDHLFLKLYLEEEDLSLHLVIDASGSADTGDPSKFLFMQKAAMALGYVGLVNLNRVSATAMGGSLLGASDASSQSVSSPTPTTSANESSRSSSPTSRTISTAIRDLRGRRRTHDLARWICSLEPSGSFAFREAADRVAMTRRGKGVMLIFSDFFFKDGYETGLRRLVGHGYDVYLIQVLSPQELDPPLTGDLRLRDIEDGDRAEVTISSPLLKRYKANLSAYCRQLSQFATQRGMTLLTVRSDTPVDTLILDYLRTKGVVR